MVPINDDFLMALPLDGNVIKTTGSNVNATGESGEPNHAYANFDDDGNHSVWWTWTALEPGIVLLDTVGSDYDTTLAVYVGTQLDTLIEVNSDDDAHGLQSGLTFRAIAGQTYYIAVDGFDQAQGSIALNLELRSPPTNDNFLDAIPLTGLTVTAQGTNIDTTGEAGEPDHAGVNANGRVEGLNVNSVWWSWTALTNGTVSMNTTGSDFDTGLAVYQGTSVTDLVAIASNDDAVDFKSALSFEAVAGQVYKIAVDGYGMEVGGIALNIELQPDLPEIIGTAQQDYLLGTKASEYLQGLAGDDVIFGWGGADLLLGQGGDDLLMGSADTDFIDGGRGHDILIGMGGGDTLMGGNGNDTLYGGADADLIQGGRGNDVIYALGGNDDIDSGVGKDTLWLLGSATVLLEKGPGFDIIHNFQLGMTTLRVSDGEAVSFTDSDRGAEIWQHEDLLAVIHQQSASLLEANRAAILAA